MLTEHERTSVVEWDCRDANNILTPILATGINFLMCNLSSVMVIEDLTFQHLFISCISKPLLKGSLLPAPPTPVPSGVGAGGRGGEVALCGWIPALCTSQK